MRYVLAGAVVLTGIILIGLAYHDTAGEAWGVLLSPTPTSLGAQAGNDLGKAVTGQ